MADYVAFLGAFATSRRLASPVLKLILQTNEQLGSKIKLFLEGSRRELAAIPQVNHSRMNKIVAP